MKTILVGAVLATATAGAFAILLAAQDLPPVADGSDHGDPPFLVESGWKPLLNGRNLDGWQLVDSTKKGQWVVTKGVIWGGTANPTLLTALPGAGDRIVNTGVDPKGNASNMYTTEKFGDVEVYVEFMVAAHSNSGFFMHGLYETQIWDSWGFTPRLDTDRCAPCTTTTAVRSTESMAGSCPRCGRIVLRGNGSPSTIGFRPRVSMPRGRGSLRPSFCASCTTAS